MMNFTVQEKVSVCMATYNGEKYVLKQLQSILQQLRPTDEVIVSDDSSTDKTLAIIESINDSRIKIYKGQTFKSPIFNFENAIKLADGDVIFLSDQDDIWSPDKVVKMLEVLKSAEMVVCDCCIIDNDEKVIVDSYFSIANSQPGVLWNLKKNTYFGCCMAFKKEVLKKALPFPKDISMHDIWLGFVSDLFFKSVFLPETLTFYRKHENNASIASNVISNLSLLTKIRFRLNIIKYLPALILR